MYPSPSSPPNQSLDIEALFQSVSAADAELDGLDDVSLDFDDLAALGDFSGLGPLDFSLDGGMPNTRIGLLARTRGATFFSVFKLY